MNMKNKTNDLEKLDQCNHDRLLTFFHLERLETY